MLLNSTSSVILNTGDSYNSVCDAIEREILIAKALERMIYIPHKEDSRKEFESELNIHRKVYGEEGVNEMKEVYERYEKVVYGE